jgi:hypothetical protein
MEKFLKPCVILIGLHWRRLNQENNATGNAEKGK